MSSIELEVTTTVDLFKISAELSWRSNEDVIAFVKMLDEHKADAEFTQMLHNYAREALKAEGVEFQSDDPGPQTLDALAELGAQLKIRWEMIENQSRTIVELREQLEQTRARAEKAEAMAEREAARAAKFELQDNGCDELIAALREMLREAVERADNAEARIEELEDRIRIHKSRIQPQDSPVPKAIIDGQGDRWELNRSSGLYEYSIFSRTLDNIEMNWGIEERIYG